MENKTVNEVIKIPKNWIEVRVTNDELQPHEKVENRIKLLLNVLRPLKEEIEKEKLVKWVFWLFEPDYQFVPNKVVNCIMVRCCTQNQENVSKIKEIIKVKLKELGFKETEQFRITEDDGLGEIDKYGEEGLESFYNFMSECCRFVLLRYKEGNQQYELLNENKFIHCFINSLGLYYPQEAERHLQLFIDRVSLMNQYPDLEDFKEQIRKIVEDYLQRVNKGVNGA